MKTQTQTAHNQDYCFCQFNYSKVLPHANPEDRTVGSQAWWEIRPSSGAQYVTNLPPLHRLLQVAWLQFSATGSVVTDSEPTHSTLTPGWETGRAVNHLSFNMGAIAGQIIYQRQGGNIVISTCLDSTTESIDIRELYLQHSQLVDTQVKEQMWDGKTGMI